MQGERGHVNAINTDAAGPQFNQTKQRRGDRALARTCTPDNTHHAAPFGSEAQPPVLHNGI